MSTFLFIQWMNPESDQVAWRRIGDQGATPVMHGSLVQVAEQTLGARVVVFVPSRFVLHTRIKVPTQNRKRLLQAIPYAIEDQLLGDPEDQHFALGNVDSDGELNLAIVQRELLEKWLADLRVAGIYPDMLLADIYALPVDEQSWHIAETGGQLIVRTAAQQGLQMHPAQLGFLLPMMQREYETLPEKIVFHSVSGSAALEQSFSVMDPVPELSTKTVDADVLLNALGDTDFDPRAVVNLLQGDYSRREQVGKYWRPWRLAASLAAVWFVLNVVSMAVMNAQLSSQEEALSEQSVAIYKQVFPDARNVPKPRLQMQRELERLGGASSSSEGFLFLLSKTGDALKTTNGLILQNIRYKQGTLDVELEVPELQVLDELKQKLVSAHADMQVEIQSAQSRENRVQGRLQIKKK